MVNNASSLTTTEEGKEIDSYSLKTLIKKYNVSSAVLKMDCEGCEYNLLNEETETLRKFKRIQIEYHYKHEPLVNKLKTTEFNVKYTNSKNLKIRM